MSEHDEEDGETPEVNTLVGVLDRLTRIQERQPIPQETAAQAKYCTPWNPTGRKDMPKLKRRVFQNGHPISDVRMTEQEINLINTLKHGRYHNRQWLVVERDEGGSTAMHIYWPNKTESDRIQMARIAPNGLADVLLMIHDEMRTPKLAE
jgi:hypothetical protein